jgi:DNA-binding LacI/PurR family transcriptional regulator
VTRKTAVPMETVAIPAGVSLATVSKVLNERADVSAATRARMQRLVAPR